MLSVTSRDGLRFSLGDSLVDVMQRFGDSFQNDHRSLDLCLYTAFDESNKLKIGLASSEKADTKSADWIVLGAHKYYLLLVDLSFSSDQVLHLDWLDGAGIQWNFS